MSELHLTLVLASKSPRRQELLSQLGFEFTTENADIDESLKTGESAQQYVERLAIEKAQAIAKNCASNTVVLGSDTAVVYQAHILGKPRDLADSINILSLLSGNTHQVYTGIAAVLNGQVISQVVKTDVLFKPLSKAEIIAYWQTQEPQDKAGSYGIQGIGGQFVKAINGSYSSVVGLPLFETTQLLNQYGLYTPLQAGSY